MESISSASETPEEFRFKTLVRNVLLTGKEPSVQNLVNSTLGRRLGYYTNHFSGREYRWRREVCQAFGFSSN